jgi:hypothetical protein
VGLVRVLGGEPLVLNIEMATKRSPMRPPATPATAAKNACRETGVTMMASGDGCPAGATDHSVRVPDPGLLDGLEPP